MYFVIANLTYNLPIRIHGNLCVLNTKYARVYLYKNMK